MSQTNGNKKMLILPEIEKKYKKKIRKTQSQMIKASKTNKKKIKGTSCYIDFKGFIELNPNPLITEYR